jgi:rhodanese-related sulfurtransferase
MKNALRSNMVALALLAANAIASPGYAAERDDLTLPAIKQTRLGLYMDATEASQWMNQWPAGTLFVDVRTLDEVSFLGSPKGIDAHVPYQIAAQPPRWDSKNGRYVLELNSRFAEMIEMHLAARGLNKASPIILICREGNRSAKAANLLAAAGYTTVYTVTDGYEGDAAQDGERKINGWRNSQLPWTMDIAQKVAY